MSDRQRSTSLDSLFVPQYVDDQPPVRTHSRLALPRLPAHFVGDGLDFRRPVISSEAATGRTTREGSHTLIDLTEDDDSQAPAARAASILTQTPVASSSRAQRPPRFGRNIIDIESEEDDQYAVPTAPRQVNSGGLPSRGPEASFNTNHNHTRFSALPRPSRHSDSTNMDDIEFIEERPLSVPQALDRPHQPDTQPQRSVTPYPAGLIDTIDLTEDDDEVEYLNTRTRHPPEVTAGVGTRSMADRQNSILGLLQEGGSRLRQRFGLDGEEGALPDRVQQQLALGQVTYDYIRNRGAFHVFQPNRNRNHLHGLHSGARAPPVAIAMDYGVTGFDMGRANASRAPTQKYEPPEPPAAGFTRNPREDEVVVCPSCGDELAMGDAEVKREVWVIKKCGHAYCGDCARNRPKSSKGAKVGKGKGKARATAAPLPFKQCVVDGCAEPASLKSMIHVFVGS